MTNYTILQQNVLSSLDTEKAKAAFLWACDLPGADRCQYKAEAFAREVDRLTPFLEGAISAACRGFEEQGIALDRENREDLLAFILKRHSVHRHAGLKRDYHDQPQT